jgi:putative hemolysin
MQALWLEISVILFLIILNGIFSLSELALISARKARLAQWAEEGDARRERVKSAVDF